MRVSVDVLKTLCWQKYSTLFYRMARQDLIVPVVLLTFLQEYTMQKNGQTMTSYDDS